MDTCTLRNFKLPRAAAGDGTRAEFKAKLVDECRQPGMSVARVARDNGVNANLLHQWIVSSRARDVGVAAVSQVAESFVPVQISPSGAVVAAAAPIVVEIQRGSATVTVNWPVETAAGMRRLVARMAALIRIDAMWLSSAPLDMRAGTDTALARVVNVFGSARPHHAYLFANKRANRMKVLVHDGIGIWLAARRLNKGPFHLVGVGRKRQDLDDI